jgi:hypothetical protein
MILSPPYPSSIGLSMSNSGEFNLSYAPLKNMIDGIMAASATYGVKVMFACAFDDTSTTDWSLFTTFVNYLAASPNKAAVGTVGIDHEHFKGVTSTTDYTEMQRAQALIQGAGFSMVNIYRQGFQGTKAQAATFEWCAETNYPHGDNAGALGLGNGDPSTVGIWAGLDAYQPFPSPGCTSVYIVGCFPGWSIQAYANGFVGTGYNDICACDNVVSPSGFPPTIRQVLDVAKGIPVANRTWTLYNAGNNGSAFAAGGTTSTLLFTGVSGVLTPFLWDHPVFRQEVQNWINDNPGVLVQNLAAAGGIKSTVLTISVS